MLAGPRRRVGTCQIQTVGENNWMGGIEGITISFRISLLVVYPPLKRSSYLPQSTTCFCFFILTTMHYFVSFSLLVRHIPSLFIEWRRIVSVVVEGIVVVSANREGRGRGVSGGIKLGPTVFAPPTNTKLAVFPLPAVGRRMVEGNPTR